MCRSERLLARDGGNFVLGFRKPQELDSPILGTAALPQGCLGADVGVGGVQALPWMQSPRHLRAKAEPCCPPCAAGTPKSLARGAAPAKAEPQLCFCPPGVSTEAPSLWSCWKPLQNSGIS